MSLPGTERFWASSPTRCSPLRLVGNSSLPGLARLQRKLLSTQIVCSRSPRATTAETGGVKNSLRLGRGVEQYRLRPQREIAAERTWGVVPQCEQTIFACDVENPLSRVLRALISGTLSGVPCLDKGQRWPPSSFVDSRSRNPASVQLDISPDLVDLAPLSS